MVVRAMQEKLLTKDQQTKKNAIISSFFVLYLPFKFPFSTTSFSLFPKLCIISCMQHFFLSHYFFNPSMGRIKVSTLFSANNGHHYTLPLVNKPNTHKDHFPSSVLKCFRRFICGSMLLFFYDFP